jgi:peptidyl-tRNA hydrolase, PTH1 family
MKLIVGLGNPGKKYEQNRHNIGFQTLDLLAQKLGGAMWVFEKKFNAEVIQTMHYILVKPQTFMNESGVSAR